MTEQPILRVVRGNPDDVEVAAITAVISAIAGGDEPASESAPQSLWHSPSFTLRQPLSAGQGGWTASARKR